MALSFNVAICTYKRYKKLKEQTLVTLEKEGIPKESITIFVCNTDEEMLYKAECPEYKIVVSAETLNEKLNFIIDYYPDGSAILVCEDDIKKFGRITPLSFRDVAEQMFGLCKSEQVSLWGIYPVHTTNNYYLKDRVVKGLKFIIGICWGIINDKRMRLPNECVKHCKDKVDRWRTLQYYKQHGAVLRYEGISPDTKWYGEGGLASSRTFETESDSAKYVVLSYPDLCSYKVKKNKHPEVMFRPIINKLLYLEAPIELAS